MESQELTLCKLIILYLLERVDFLMTGAQISDFVLGRDYADYLTLSQAQSELLETGLIAVSEVQSAHNRTHLCITPGGRDTLRYFRSRISADDREAIEEYLRENALALRNELSVYGDYYRQTSGSYEAHLVVQDRDEKLLDLTIPVPTEDLARRICDGWGEKSERVYRYLVGELFG